MPTEHAIYMREWRKKNPASDRAITLRWRKNNPASFAAHLERKRKKERLKFPEKVAAWRAVGLALESGKLERPRVCSVCGLPGKPEAHHDDYAKPLEIIWVCSECHRDIHKRSAT